MLTVEIYKQRFLILLTVIKVSYLISKLVFILSE